MPFSVGREPLVVATFSRRMTLRLATGDRVSARVKGRKLHPVCGDRVEAAPIANESEWLITSILPRKNELRRPNTRGQIETLAANLSFLVVVAADPPAPDWFIVDRYLCAAELMGVSAAVVYNKTDLAAPDDDTRTTLQDYEDVGYLTLLCSARSGSNMDALQDLLAAQTAIIVGQSGVGKSSLINRLSESADLPTAAVSRGSGEGRHTTVNSVMLTLPNGGAVIDSPGVRDFAPGTANADEVIRGFREIARFGASCRFANCRHLREPDCAVKTAVDDGRISPRRYESYRRLLALTRKLSDKKYQSPSRG
jgi:ribosome biogenesis GTPase / thiamine phosphate phosphatase